MRWSARTSRRSPSIQNSGPLPLNPYPSQDRSSPYSQTATLSSARPEELESRGVSSYKKRGYAGSEGLEPGTLETTPRCRALTNRYRPILSWSVSIARLRRRIPTYVVKPVAVCLRFPNWIGTPQHVLMVGVCRHERQVAPFVDPTNHLALRYVLNEAGYILQVVRYSLDTTCLAMLRFEDAEVRVPVGLASLERALRCLVGNARWVLFGTRERASIALNAVAPRQCISARCGCSVPVDRRCRLERRACRCRDLLVRDRGFCSRRILDAGRYSCNLARSKCVSRYMLGSRRARRLLHKRGLLRPVLRRDR